MSNEVNSSNIDANIQTVVKKKKKVLPIIFGIVGGVLGLIFVVVAIIVAFSVGKAGRLQEQLDLGQKYLNELNYEQAITSYELAIEIDPMSADAYLGLAAAYMSAGNFEKAMEILNLGYEKTGNEVILTQMQVFEEAMAYSGDADGQADGIVSGDEYVGTLFGSEGNVNIDYNMPKVPEIEIDGVVHAAYYDYNLTDESKVYFDTLIGLLDENSYEEAQKMFTVEAVTKLTQSIGDGLAVRVNMVYGNKKILLDVGGVYDVYMLIIPIEAGMGYGLRKVSSLDKTVDTYLYCDCLSGQFNGTYTCYEKTVYEDGETNIRKVGMTTNGLLDGESYTYYDLYTDVYSYSDGFLVYTNLKENEDSSITYNRGKRIYEDGREEDIVSFWSDTDAEQINYNFESYLYSIIYPLTSMVHGVEPNSETKYCYW